MRLGVNIDHIATLRQARRGRLPDPVEAALMCERAGADSIVCHLREDRRHIQDADVRRLRRTIRTRLNLEMSIAPEVVAVALAVRPHQVTFVPERRQELTTEGGLDVVQLRRRLAPLVRRFYERGIKVSVFVDPSARQLEAARAIGVRLIELHTGRFANARNSAGAARELAALSKAAERGAGLGLTVTAGHGLDYNNARALCNIPQVKELNIGYAIIVRALSTGLEEAVREMAAMIDPKATHAAPALQSA